MTDMAQDQVTGARTGVALLVDLPVERLWELVTDVPRYGEWSPECVAAAWLDGGTGRVGDRFTGHNRFGTEPGAFESTVTCVVTERSRPAAFAWHVLDDDGRPASIWRYTLAPAGEGRTLLRHGFEHGPGVTVTRLTAADDPNAVDERLAQLRHDIAVSLDAMLGGASYREVEPA